MPSIFNSPRILGARHKGLAVASSSIRRRISPAVAGLPRRRRFLLDKPAQNLRNRSRCQRTTVSAWTYIRGEHQRFHSRESQNSRSREVRTGRLRCRWKAASRRKSSILRRHGRMTAEEESRKTKQEQGEGWHRPRFLDHMLMKVKPLSANRILANHSLDSLPSDLPNNRSIPKK